jgi:hypothetical protein
MSRANAGLIVAAAALGGCLGDPPRPYHASAVRFDSTEGDYLSQPSLEGAKDSNSGTFSVWVRFEGSGDGQSQPIIDAAVLGFPEDSGITRTADNHFTLTLWGCGVLGVAVQANTANVYTTADGWIHVMASWDIGHRIVQLYVNGQLDLALNPTINNYNICYNGPNYDIGAAQNVPALDADLADLYADLTNYVDLSSAANLERFRTKSGKPVDLGRNCRRAGNGSTPILCLTNPAATWYANQGTGSGMTLNGDGLAAAATSPSD